MPITDIPILAMLRERMQWQQARQQVLAENVANADTPDYQAKDLVAPDFARESVGRFGGAGPHQSEPYRRLRPAARNSPPTKAAITKSGRAATRSATKTR